MKKLLSLALFATVAASPAFAEVNLADYPDLELGKVYELEFMGSFRGKFTPSVSGQIIEYGTVPVFLLKDGELSLMTAEQGYQYTGYINGLQSHQFAVEAGTTYFFESAFNMNTETFSIEMNLPVVLMQSDPAVGRVFDPAENHQLGLVFNQNVNIEKATVSVGDLQGDAEVRISSTTGSTVDISFNDLLSEWYKKDLIKGGEKLSVTISGVTNSLGEKVDDMTFDYVAAHKPVELTDAVLPAQVLSWYADETVSSKAVFTFSGAMAQNPIVELCYAPIELGYDYIESLDATVEGNVITVDLSGKRRTSADMSPTGRKDTNIYVRLLKLKDADGQTVWSPGQGTVGSFIYDIPFVEIPRLNITSEFTPSTGSSLENAKEIKIYFNCADALQYTGVSFTSGNETAVVNTDEIKVDQISTTEVELTVPVPDGWASKANVIVSLDGLTSTDGYDHSSDIAAKFNGFTLLYSSIKDGAKLKSLAEGSIVKVETNLVGTEKLTFEILDTFGPAEMTSVGEGVYTLTMPSTVVFEIDKTYTVEFKTENGGVETLSIIGDTAPYEFSDIVLERITPENGSAITAETEISMTFNGLVMVTPKVDSDLFEVVSVYPDDEGFGNVWTIKVPGATAEKVTISFTATDMDGKVVEGNQGVDAESFFLFTFNDESSISEISAASASATYDLQGRKVNAPSHGIFIRNGKKIRL